MSQFDESKLSRILARRIIAPEDRSQFLPMCTPIYCPDNNGVKASQVTIIDPNLNTFFDDADPTNTRSKYIGSQINSKVITTSDYNSILTVVGSPTNNDGIVSGLIGNTNYLYISSNNYPSNEFKEVVLVFTTASDVTVAQNIWADDHTRLYLRILNGNFDAWNSVSSTNTNILSAEANTEYYFKIIKNEISSTQYRIDYYQSTNQGTSWTLITSITQNKYDTIGNVGVFGNASSNQFQGQANLRKSYYKLDNDDTIYYLYEQEITGVDYEVTRQPNEVQNIINIDLNKSVSRDYFVPYEVELKSDADIISVIKSDFAAYFKNRVSNEIFEQLVTLHTTDAISTINMGASLAETLGDVISTFVSQGTGQKYSIYKYNNGAPVVYSENSNQPNIDKDIDQTPEIPMSIYARMDDINVPALYYVERPTLILPNTTYADYQAELCNGSIKEYARKMVNVETATANFGQLGEGVFGTNDTFAVAFSSPSIKLVPDTNFYGYRLCCTMLYGVKLVHKHNLRLIV